MAGDAGQGGEQGRALRGELFERIFERIHRYFLKLIYDPQSVDDCLQQTLLRLERSLQEGTYDPRQSFNRWMWIKAHSVYVDYCRSRSRAAGALAEGDAEQAVSAAGHESAVDGKLDLKVVLLRMREELDTETFETFVLRYDQSLSITEVAKLTGRDRKTVRKHLERAVRFAKGLLGSVEATK
jgi:RNA polymerase sigma factor (sigma-70 family)